MANVLAFAETRGGELRKVAFEAVTAARQAADTVNGEVHAIVMGAPGIAGRGTALGKYGADCVITVEHEALERYSPEVFAATVAERLRSGGYRGGFFSASAQAFHDAKATALVIDSLMPNTQRSSSHRAKASADAR